TADQIDQRAFARPAMSHQANHFAGGDVQVDAAQYGAIAVAKAHVAQFDLALYVLDANRLGRFWHTGDMVENVENAFGSSGGFLCKRPDATHRIQTQVEPADVGKERGEHAHRDFV